MGQTTSFLKCCSVGANPAQPEMGDVLGQKLRSILSEVLGHERGHKYLSIHGFKSHQKHPLVLLLNGQKDNKNSPLTGYKLVGAREYFALGFALPLADLIYFSAF